MTIRTFLAAATLAVTSLAGKHLPVRPSVDGARAMSSRIHEMAPSLGQDIERRAPAPWSADDPADSLYRSAREALNRGEYRAAAASFAQIVERYPDSAYAADALYWEAYAHYRIGDTGELRAALRALDAQKSRYPKAATRGDADALAVRVRGALARAGDADAAESVTAQATQVKPCRTRTGKDPDDDDDERAAALNALMQMNAEQAMPILRQVLARRDACSASLREKAVFLVSQKRTAETEDILLDVVRNDPDSDVQSKAVFWLGQVHTDRAAQALEQMLLSKTTNEELREQAVFALTQQRTARGWAVVRAVAEDAQQPLDLREKAVFWLGQARSTENARFLRTLFDKLASSANKGRDDDLAQKILFSLSQMRGEGNDKWLMEIAADPKFSVDVRKQAIFSAGQSGVSTAELSALYGKLSDGEIKGQVIWVLSQQRDPAAVDRLIDIAKHDSDREMRKKAIFWLGQSRDPRVKQLLLDIINGG
jgi:TolA-binding protein